ncbi:hypothetical protein Syun_004636 [Stephania yunnanensis]|uniref:Uncharacterized protein n=1 Tax=Stephania yunnanensis TaxID=152371 RepID=A0AAP0Q2R2_9MAGN
MDTEMMMVFIHFYVDVCTCTNWHVLNGCIVLQNNISQKERSQIDKKEKKETKESKPVRKTELQSLNFEMES